jgi:hypothetical protein
MTQIISIAANFDESPPAHVTMSRGRYRFLSPRRSRLLPS